MSIVHQRQTQFIGTRTLALTFKFLTMSMRFKQTRDMMKDHIESLLFNISLPLFMTSQKELQTF